jgi:glycosyltransferase involved in cell wall biosynthesis
MSVGVAPYPLLPEFYFSPLKIYEYMASGLPVVASRIGDIPNVIDDGRNGLLCTPGDPVALANTLGRLRDDEALRRRLGRSAREKVLHKHTWSAVVQRILTLAGCDATEHARCAGGGH